MREGFKAILPARMLSLLGQDIVNENAFINGTNCNMHDHLLLLFSMRVDIMVYMYASQTFDALLLELLLQIVILLEIYANT